MAKTTRQLLARLRPGSQLALPKPNGNQRTTWSLTALSGRLIELSSPGGSSALTLAFSMVLDAQRAGEPVGWLTDNESNFFPPDAAQGGIDLDALVVVKLARLTASSQMPRAAEHLARSGAFGLLVLDLGETAHVPVPMQMRLLALAKTHESAVLFLTRKRSDTASLGTLISLRAEASRTPVGHPAPTDTPAREASVSSFTCQAQILKDKRCGPGWTHVEVCRGPDGLR